MTVPVSLSSLVVSGGGSELARFEGDALKAVTAPFVSASTTVDVGPSAVVVSTVDVILPGSSYDTVPSTVTHTLTYAIPDNAPLRTIVGSVTASGSPVGVPRDAPVVIQSLLRGPGWLNANGCCLPSAHRGFLLPSNGILHAPEVFAIDWLLLKDGQLGSGDGSKVTDFFGYGQPIYAATDGVVIFVRNDQPDAPINASSGGNDTVKTPADYSGNGLVVQVNDHQYAAYAHMIPGSVIPKVGDKITTGTPWGKLGNSGNSSNPHLHFGLSDGPDAFLSASSIPFVVKSWTLTGNAVLGASGITVTPANTPQQETYPLLYSVADFGQ